MKRFKNPIAGTFHLDEITTKIIEVQGFPELALDKRTPFF
jgi:hypothetical protein